MIFFQWQSSKIGSNRRVNFCDNGNEREDCEPCPSYSICSGGLVVDCSKNFQLVQGENCVDIKTLNHLSSKMTLYSYDLLASLNGYNLCHEKGNHENFVFNRIVVHS